LDNPLSFRRHRFDQLFPWNAARWLKPLPRRNRFGGHAFFKRGLPQEFSAMKSIYFGASALSLLLLAGMASAAPSDQPGHVSPAPGTNSNAASAVKDTTAGVVGKVSAEMTHTTKGFVSAATTSDMYASDTLPAVQDHLAMVKKIEADMKTASK
jgi:hypothetical protein